MNRNMILVAAMLAVPLTAPAQDSAPVKGLESNLQKFSYAMGYRAARELMEKGVVEIDTDAFGIGANEAVGGKNFRFSPDEIRAAWTAHQKDVVDRQAKKALENGDAGKAFMADNAQKDGIKKLPSGIQYKIVNAGTGAKPTVADKVKVHYVGTLISGKEFDSSRRRGDPAVFGLGQVIQGWQKALAEMPVGSRWIVWIPPELGYGLRGSGANIGPNETLVFDVELLDIIKEPVAKAPASPAPVAKTTEPAAAEEMKKKAN